MQVKQIDNKTWNIGLLCVLVYCLHKKFHKIYIFLESNDIGYLLGTNLYLKKYILIKYLQSTCNYIFAKYDVEQQGLCPVVSASAVQNSIKPKLLSEYELEWDEKLNSDVAMRGINACGNKLRTYRKLKHSCSTEPYVKSITSKKYRSAMQSLDVE